MALPEKRGVARVRSEPAPSRRTPVAVQVPEVGAVLPSFGWKKNHTPTSRRGSKPVTTKRAVWLPEIPLVASTAANLMSAPLTRNRRGGHSLLMASVDGREVDGLGGDRRRGHDRRRVARGRAAEAREGGHQARQGVDGG